MPWESKSKNFGFSNSKPWLPIDKRYENLCVDVQENDPASTLNFTKAQIALRKNRWYKKTQ